MRLKTGNNKRIRYNIPTYKKVYSVYQYHRNKYSSIFKKIQALQPSENKGFTVIVQDEKAKKMLDEL